MDMKKGDLVTLVTDPSYQGVVHDIRHGDFDTLVWVHWKTADDIIGYGPDQLRPIDDSFLDRLGRIASDIRLADNFTIKIGQDELQGAFGRYYYQIQCWRLDVITYEMGFGYGGKAYLSEFASDSELVQTIFGLYKGYFEHEARESFQWKGRRVFGPHIKTEALWEIANRVDVRSAKHVDDRPKKLDPLTDENPGLSTPLDSDF